MSPATSRGVDRSRRRRLVYAAVLVLFGSVAGGLWLRRTVLIESETRMVLTALESGRLEEAAAGVERMSQSSPQSAEVHYLKARIAWARKDLPAVDRELERARALGYSPGPVARLRGLLLARANQTVKAEPLLRQAFDSGTEPDPEVAEALVRIYLGAFRLAEAGAVLDHWLRAAPQDARPYLLRTEVDARTSVAPEVIMERYRAALRLDPTLDQARLGLADYLRVNRRYAEAAAEYAAYLARKPDDPLGCLGAGQSALELGDEAEAVRLLDRALTLAPQDSVVLAARAQIELRRGKPEAALGYYDRAVQCFPFDAGHRYQRMLILARLGKKTEAEAEHQAVEQLRKDEADFNRLQKRLLTSPQDSRLRFEAAQWLMAHGREQEAVEWANLVLASQPADPATHRLLAAYYRSKGEVGRANFHEAFATASSRGSATVP
jgi:tetratricopeptide (TPR) repeat protein